MHNEVMPDENPAKLLYARLLEWQDIPSDPDFTYRSSEDGDWLTPHLEALTWLGQVRDRLNAMRWEEAKVLRLTDALGAGILSPAARPEYPDDPSAGQFRDADLAQLSLLAAMWGEVTHEFDASTLSELAGTAREMISLIADASYLDDEVRHYLLDLCQHLEKACTNIGVFGAGQLRSLANELVGALVLYLADAPEEDRSKAGELLGKFRELAGKVFRVAVPVAVEKGIEGAAGVLTTGR